MLFDGVLGRTHPTFRHTECSTLPLMTHSLVWGLVWYNGQQIPLDERQLRYPDATVIDIGWTDDI